MPTVGNGIITGRNRIRGNLRPPKDAVPTGELYRGQVVYRETRNVMGRRPKRDPDQNIIWVTTPEGRKIRPQYESYVERVEEREYVIVDLGNNTTRRHYTFRATKEEEQADRRRAEQAENMNALSALAEAIREAKIDPRDLAAAIRGQVVAQQPEQPPPAQETEDELKARMEKVRAARKSSS